MYVTFAERDSLTSLTQHEIHKTLGVSKLRWHDLLMPIGHYSVAKLTSFSALNERFRQVVRVGAGNLVSINVKIV